MIVRTNSSQRGPGRKRQTQCVSSISEKKVMVLTVLFVEGKYLNMLNSVPVDLAMDKAFDLPYFMVFHRRFCGLY